MNTLPKKHSLKNRLILGLMGVAIAVGLTNFLLYKTAYQNESYAIFKTVSSKVESILADKLAERAENLIKILSKQLFNPIYNDNFSEINQLLNTHLEIINIETIQVMDDEGFIFHDGTRNLELFGSQHKEPELIQKVLSENEIIKFKHDDLYCIAAPISQNDIVLGVVYMELSTEKLMEELHDNQTILDMVSYERQSQMFVWQMIIMGFSLVFGIALAYKISSSFAKPMTKIIEQMGRTENGRFQSIDFKSETEEVGQLIAAFNQMRSDVDEHTNHIEYMAFHDQLTQLPNRIRFTQLTDDLIASPNVTQLSVFFIDLDDFKFINDNYGHNIGDQLITHVAQRISTLVNSAHFIEQIHSDEKCIFSRVAGDEFLLAVPHSGQTRVTSLANHLLTAIRKPIEFDTFKFHCTATLGVCTSPSFGDTAEQLSRQAELAMFQLKNDGKNAYRIFTHDMQTTIERGLYIERELRNAMDDLSQFELWYQPKFCIQTQQIIGAEALVRWNHPTQGYIGPDQFIPVAERTDIILTLGEHLITLAAKQLSVWRENAPQGFYIALNLSPRQLHRQDIVSIMSAELKKYDLPSSMLHVEVTESLLLNDKESVKRILEQFSSLGIKVWLDDFGTGYSSLSYLKEFRFDGLKIDRSFIMNISSENNDTALIEAILSIASSLTMPTVAEGIETEYQLNKLKSLGCESGQGYFIGRPVPASEFYHFAKVDSKALSEQESLVY